MLRLLRSLLSGTISVLRDRRDLALENLALRQQLAVYYAGDRTHLSLDKDAPDGRPVEAQTGTVVELPRVGGLHHRYARLAA